MRRLLEEEQLTTEVEIDSAGTGDWHVGEPPDHRARAAGQRRGIALEGRARRVVAKDFEFFDYVLLSPSRIGGRKFLSGFYTLE